MAQEAGVPLSYDQARLAESRAQFVANLGRRLEAIRQALTALERSPRSSAHRDNLRRRVHALGAAAGVLGFDRVRDAFADAEGALARAAQSGRVTEEDLANVSRMLDLAPSLALGGQSAPVSLVQPDRPPATEGPGSGFPLSVLVVASPSLGEALSAQPTAAGAVFEFHQTDNPNHAETIVQAVAPDVVVLDSDRSGARELIGRILSDPKVDPVQVVVVGSFDRPEAAAGLVALGVARVLPKPVGPETLRRTVLEVAREGLVSPAPVEPLGDLTVEALAERVAREVRRGLVEAVKPLNRGSTVALGDGTDALATVWAAVARLRELVTMRSGGTIRFDASGPEGAVPLAPWSADDRRHFGAVRGHAARDVDLRGRRIVVADDDPSIVWFLSGLLTSAGAEVFEAHDGREALGLTREHWPDLVISDILMPELDGFSLCREIKRDIVLADVPVILLSWKEDLLQRVRELGADAEGYLRKEAPGSTVLDRVREVLWPRFRVESRLAAGGEVRGRLDGFTPRTLLHAVCSRRMSVHVAIRDSAYLYEVQVRTGRVRAVTRTATDGAGDRAERALAGLLGVRSGRFVVRDDAAETRSDFDGELAAIISEPVRRARAATRLLGDPALFEVTRVVFDESAVASYASATPRQVRAIISRLAAGARPAELVESGGVGVALIESVLLDLVRHGAVAAIHDAEGTERLAMLAAEPEPAIHSSGIAAIVMPTPAPSVELALAEVVRDRSQTPAPVVETTSTRTSSSPASAGQLQTAEASPKPRVVTQRPQVLEPKGWSDIVKKTPAGASSAPASVRASTRDSVPLEQALNDSSQPPAKRKSLASLALPESWGGGREDSTTLVAAPPTERPEEPGPGLDDFFDDGQAFAALLGGDDEPAAPSVRAEKNEEHLEQPVGSRAAPETKTTREPSPFAAAFDRLGADSSPFDDPGETKEVDQGWSIVIDEVSAPASAVEPAPAVSVVEKAQASSPPAAEPVPASLRASSEQAPSGGESEDSGPPSSSRAEERMTREMPPGMRPPEAAFRSSPPETSPEAIELGVGLAAALAGSPEPPAVTAAKASEPVEAAIPLVPSSKFTSPKGPPRPSHPPAWATQIGLGPSGPAAGRAPGPRADVEDGLPEPAIPLTERSKVAGTASELARAADAQTGGLRSLAPAKPSASSPSSPRAEAPTPGPPAAASDGSSVEGPARPDAPAISVGEPERISADPLFERTLAPSPDPLAESPLESWFAAPNEDEDRGAQKGEHDADHSGSQRPVSVVPRAPAAPAESARRRKRRSPPPQKTSWARVAGIALATIAMSIVSFSVVRAIAPKPGSTASPASASAAPIAPTQPAAPALHTAASSALPTVNGEQPAEQRAPAPGLSAALKVESGLVLPEGLGIGPDKGLLELDTGDAHTIYVDGVFVGRGPVRRVPIGPGTHQVRLMRDDEETTHSVEVLAGKRTRLAAPTASP